MADDNAYSDDLTPEEEAKLAAGSIGGDLQPDAAAAAAEPGDGQPPAGDPPTAAAAAAPSEDEEYQAWLDQHQGKSPEEIQRLAFNQSKRASKEAFQARRTGETLQAFQDRLAQAQERQQQRRSGLTEEQRRLTELLETDPDAATKELIARVLGREEDAIETEADEAQQDAAIALAATAIPNFERRAPEIHRFGTHDLGYSPAEMGEIRDGRHFVTLYLATVAGNLMKSGVLDLNGNFMQPPSAVSATDPRLQPPAAAVRTLGGSGARAAGGASTVDDQIKALNAMSDEELDKIPAAEIERLLRAAA